MIKEMTTFHIMVNDEYARNARMITAYEKAIKELPKGSLQLKKNGHYYLSYRNNEGKLVTEYVKDIDVLELQDKIETRKKHESVLKKLVAEKKEIEYALRFSEWRVVDNG